MYAAEDAQCAAEQELAACTNVRVRVSNLERAWGAWNSMVRADERFRLIATRILRCKLSRCWGCWILVAAQRHARDRTLYGALLICVYNALARGWRFWLHANVYANTARELLSMVVRHRRTLCWRRWQRERCAAAHEGCTLQCVLLRARHSELCRGWRAWSRYLAAAWQQFDAIDRAARANFCKHAGRAWQRWDALRREMLRRRHLTMRQGLLRMSRRNLARGWACWVQLKSGVRHATMERVLRYLHNRGLVHGWVPWAHLAATGWARRRRGRLATRHARRASLLAVLTSWRCFWRASLRAQAEARRHARLRLQGLLGPPPRPKTRREFVELLDARTTADAKRLRCKMDVQRDWAHSCRTAVVAAARVAQTGECVGDEARDDRVRPLAFV